MNVARHMPRMIAIHLYIKFTQLGPSALNPSIYWCPLLAMPDRPIAPALVLCRKYPRAKGGVSIRNCSPRPVPPLLFPDSSCPAVLCLGDRSVAKDNHQVSTLGEPPSSTRAATFAHVLSGPDGTTQSPGTDTLAEFGKQAHQKVPPRQRSSCSRSYPKHGPYVVPPWTKPQSLNVCHGSR